MVQSHFSQHHKTVSYKFRSQSSISNVLNVPHLHFSYFCIAASTPLACIIIIWSKSVNNSKKKNECMILLAISYAPCSLEYFFKRFHSKWHNGTNKTPYTRNFCSPLSKGACSFLYDNPCRCQRTNRPVFINQNQNQRKLVLSGA
jgi:hypothetical protein